MGGAGTGAGEPPVDPVLPDDDELLDDELELDEDELAPPVLLMLPPPVELVLDDPLDENPPVDDQPWLDEP